MRETARWKLISEEAYASCMLILLLNSLATKIETIQDPMEGSKGGQSTERTEAYGGSAKPGSSKEAFTQLQQNIIGSIWRAAFKQ
eukprot:c15285_g1_i1 orf=131-385(+)